MEKLNTLLVISLLVAFYGCNKEEDSVKVEYYSFGVYDYEYVRDFSLYITKDKCLCSYNQDNFLVTLEISEPVAKSICLLADSLFIEETAKVYSSKKKTDCQQFHEGDQMDITATKDGNHKYQRHFIGEIYCNANEPQFSEDYYEYVYSDTYRLFCQYLELVQAYISGQEAWNCYTDWIREMDRESEADVFPAILQACNSMKTRVKYRLPHIDVHHRKSLLQQWLMYYDHY